MAPSPPPTSTASAPPPATPEQLRALYDQAVATGDAAELVRELCRALGVSLRGLAELTGVTYQTLFYWQAGKQRAMDRTLRDVKPLLNPSRQMLRRVEVVRSRLPFGLRGRPRKDYDTV